MMQIDAIITMRLAKSGIPPKDCNIHFYPGIFLRFGECGKMKNNKIGLEKSGMSLQDRICMKKLFILLEKTPAIIYDDEALNEAVNYAYALENHEQQILSMGKYTLSDILYGRYYWFTKFLFRYERHYGKDASMEQQQFKIVEAMDYAECVDCALLEKIEQDLKDYD